MAKCKGLNFLKRQGFVFGLAPRPIGLWAKRQALRAALGAARRAKVGWELLQQGEQRLGAMQAPSLWPFLLLVVVWWRFGLWCDWMGTETHGDEWPFFQR